MKRGYEMGGKFSSDPIGSDAPRGKNRERRKHRNDGNTLTPTENHIKQNLMRQFMKNPEGGGIGNSESYRNSECWDANGRLKP